MDNMLKRIGHTALSCGAIAFVLGLLVWEQLESHVARLARRRTR